MAVVYVLMYFKCKICFTVYTGETKINVTYLHVQLSSGFRYIHFIGYATFVYPIQALVDDLNIMLINAKRHFNIYKHDKFRAQLSCRFLVIETFLS